MSIRKPIQASIDATDFRNKAYSFAVESVLAPEEVPGIVVVSVSAGYWLITSLTNRPKREQTIAYRKQLDSSWMASDTVTVVYTGDSPTPGTVLIRKSPSETVVLTIAPGSTASELSTKPVLTVSKPTLTFASTSSGKPGFQVITVSQLHSDDLVTLTTDSPDYFQFATDSQPKFASTLTFLPAPTGTHVHARYAASHRGFHAGQLTIQSSYDTKTVALTGQRALLSPAVRLSPRVRVQPQHRSSARLRKGMRQGIGLLALLLAGSLFYTGYVNRCQLFPGLCPDAVIDLPITRAARPEPVVKEAKSLKRVAGKTKTGKSVTRTAEAPAQQRSVSESADRLVQEPKTEETEKRQEVAASRNVARDPIVQKKRTNQSVDDAVNNRRIKPAPSTGESELERELNQPTRNQL